MMAEANRSMEEIVESVGSGSSSHRPIGPFGPIPRNTAMEEDGTFARTPIVAGEMPRRLSNTSTASAAYQTARGSGSESGGYRTTSEHREDSEDREEGEYPAEMVAADRPVAATDSLLPSQLAKNYKAMTYWSRSGDSDSTRGGRTAAQQSVRDSSPRVTTSSSSSRSEPATARERRSSRRDLDTAEGMTYEERRSARVSDRERYRNVSSSMESSGGERRGFPFQRTEAGGMRVTEGMVAYQDRNLAILVADPSHTRLKVQAKEKHAKSGGSVTDRVSADIHASYDNLSGIQQREASSARHSSGGSHRSGTARREEQLFYETSEHDSQRRQGSSRHWEAESAAHGRSERRSEQRSEHRSSRAGGGSQRSLSRRNSGFSFDPCGSDSAGSVGEGPVSERRRSVSPRPAASARLSPAEDPRAAVQRALHPAANTDGQETDGFTTRYVRPEAAGSRRAASATTLYMPPTAASTAAATAGGSAQATAGYGQRDRGLDEAGYPRRASGDWRRRSSSAQLVIEDEVCDLEEREEVFSGVVKERISRQIGDAESSLEKSARRTRDEQQARSAGERAITGGYRYSGASGGQREKRELGCLAEEAVRSASSVQDETDCYITVDGTEVPVVSWAVRRYSRYLQRLGRRSPRRLALPQGSGSPEALSTLVDWCYLPPSEAGRLITPDNCGDVYQAAEALEIPELMEQCRGLMERQEETLTTRDPEQQEELGWRQSQQQQQWQQWPGEGLTVTVNTGTAEETAPSQARRRRSSFGSSSPKRSYSRLYTREEHEAAVVIQSGYRGFRARQELKARGIHLGQSSAGASYSRRVSSARSSSSRRLSSQQSSPFRRVSSQQSSSSRRMSSAQRTEEPSSAQSAHVAFEPGGASVHGSRVSVQKQPSGSTAARQGSRTAAVQQESQRRTSADQWRSSETSDGIRTVYEDASARPSQSAAQEGRRISHTGAAHVSRLDTTPRSAARSRSRSASRSRVSFCGGGSASSREHQAALVIQRNFRSFSARVHYEEQRYAAATLQRYMRGHLARKLVKEMHQAAAKIQNCFREHLDEKRGRMDPEVSLSVNRVVSSSSDWKRRSLLHPEGSTVLVMAGLNPMKDYCAKYNSGRDMYRYEPFQNAWEYVGQVPEPRHHASVAYLRGLIYLLGGTDPCRKDGAALDTVWVLDPTTGDWWLGPPMKHARIHHGTAVAQGQLYVIGGQDADGCALTNVELFDPDRAAWAELAPMGCARLGVAAAVHHHRVWVVGGMCPVKKQDVVTAVDIYDTIRRRWCQGPPLRQPRCFSRLVVCARRLFLVGGAGRSTRHQRALSSVDTVDRFAEEQRAWVHVAQMKTSRHGHAVVPLNEQEFLVLGGVSSQQAAALSLVEQYNVRSNQWVRGVAPLPGPLSGLAAVTVPRRHS